MTVIEQTPFHPRRRRRRRNKRRKSASPAQHPVLSQQQIETDLGRVSVVIDEIESPLGWLARRRGRDGRPLIEVHQLQVSGCARILPARR